MAVRQGITPTFTLNLLSDTLDLTECENVYATFQQGNTALTKTGDEITVREQVVEVYLEQEETLGFSPGRVLVQLNWTYADGSRGCSEVVSVPWAENLLKEVLE